MPPTRSRRAQTIKALNPDVITLDVEMPNMNGLDFLEKIMRLRPMPVIMVSSLTSRDAAATITALEIGAFDCISKASFADEGAYAALQATVKAAARAQIKPLAGTARQASGHRAPPAAAADYVPNGCGGGDRLVDRRRRGADQGAVAAARELPADGDHPAHAAAPSPRASPSASTA